ncbi:tetraspanin-32 isoform X2 [Larus michahellis]|uniref:tetraspanin-32 isoform X2 n=1 Tax=Larus michahellis TaxID=119627 RepID=UPI003D9B796A
MEVHVRPVDLHCEAKAVLGILFLPAFEANSRGPFWLLLLELVGNGGNWGMLLLDVVKFNISLESNSYRVIHHTAFYFGICLSMTLILAALLSSAATVRESQLLTAMGFFCFALAFCGLIPAACWRYTHSTEVEDSMMDVYDLVYEEVRRNASSFRRHELTAIHEAFLCCGKHSPFGDTANVETKTCPSSQDCLQEIRDFLKKHMDFVSTLLGIAIVFTVYGMILTSFLWFSIHFSSNLDRKGKYILRER